MKKALIVLAVFSLLLFPASIAAQGGCTTWDFTTGDQGWTSAWGSYSPGVGWVSSDGFLNVSGTSGQSLYYQSARATFTTTTINDVIFNLDGATLTVYNDGSQTFVLNFSSRQINSIALNINDDATLTTFELCEATIEPTPTPIPTASPGDEGGWLGITEVITLPYEFTPIDISTPSAPSLPLPDLLSVPFINQIGSIALTLMALFDQYQVLGIFVILLVAMLITFWLWTYVTGTPSQVTLKVSEGVNAAGQVINVQDEVLQEGVNYYQDNALYLDRVDPYAHQRYLAAQGKIDSNKRLVSGMKQGAKLFRKAKKDFSGNPFK